MRPKCRVVRLLLVPLLVAGWVLDAQAGVEQFGWSAKERRARASLTQGFEQGSFSNAAQPGTTTSSSSINSPWQQPVTVSINPQRPPATAVQPLPPVAPAPTEFSLPAVGSQGFSNVVQLPKRGPGFRPPKTTTTSGSSSSNGIGSRTTGNGLQFPVQTGQGQWADNSLGASQLTGADGIPPGSTVIDISDTDGPGGPVIDVSKLPTDSNSLNQVWSNRGSSSSSGGGGGRGGSGNSVAPGVNEFVSQTPGTTVKVLAGQQGSVNTVTSKDPQQVTIISISPAGNGLAVSNPAGPASIWRSDPGSSSGFSGPGAGTTAQQQQQQQQQRPRPGQGQAGQQILPALPTDGLEPATAANDVQPGQSGAGGNSLSPEFHLSGSGVTAESPAGQTLKPVFGGPGAKGRSGSSKQTRQQKRPPSMIPVGTAPVLSSSLDSDDSSAAAGGLLDSLGPNSSSKAKPVDSSGAFRGPASPWQQEKRLIGKAEARGQMEAKACGCASFKFDFVCGMDGLTYANPCMAQCGGTQVSYTGPCEATWSALPKSSTVQGVANRDTSSSSSSSSEEDLYQDELVLDHKTADFDSEARYNGDYEYYYDDGRAPVPAPPRRQTPGAAPAPLPTPVPIPVNPLRPPPAVAEDDGPYEDEEDMTGQAQPPPLPQVFGPEPIPEPRPTVPVPAPTPIKITNPATMPPKDNRGKQDKIPIPRVPVRAPPPAPPPSPPQGLFKPPVPIRAVPLPSSGPPSGLPALAGKHATHVQAPKPWVLRQEGATNTVLIGCILPFEGDLRLAGNAVYHALKLAVSEEAPTLLPDYNINLTCVNTKCADIPSHRAMEGFVKDKAVAVVGEICSAATVAAAGVATSSRLPLISPAATSPALSGNDMFFRTVPSDKFQGQAAANLLIKKGYRNVAIVYEDAAYGYGLAFNFIAAFTKEGGNVPVVVMFTKGHGKPKQDLLQVKDDAISKNLDAVFVATNNLTYAAAFLKAAENNDLGLTIFSGDALADPMMVTLLKDQPSALKGLSVTTVNKGKNSFIRRFRSAFPDVTYGSFAAQGYDAMVALLKAYASAAPSRDGQDLADQLQQQQFEGVSGPIAFDKNGDVVPHSRTYMWVKHNTTTGVPVVKGYISRMV